MHRVYSNDDDGVIQLTLDKNGLNSYSATILEGIDENGNKVPVTHGFTIHGFRIDEENQAAYVSITNAQNWVEETTSVYVEKKWDDTEDHTYDSVTVYLNVTDPNGTVRRIREVIPSEENDWKYTWMNLPKFTLDAVAKYFKLDDFNHHRAGDDALLVAGVEPGFRKLGVGLGGEDIGQLFFGISSRACYLWKTE